MLLSWIFQPTRPLRGATGGYATQGQTGIDFNPRAPCGARQAGEHESYFTIEISTHAPLAGRDFIGALNSISRSVFQPTRPLRGATEGDTNITFALGISTHAPLAGRDYSKSSLVLYGFYFNPRAPCGARQQKCTNHYAHFCDNRQISDAFAQNAACQGILLLFDAGKSCGFWVRTAQVISAHLCFAL